jgi:signal transduction histidine kinase
LADSIHLRFNPIQIHLEMLELSNFVASLFTEGPFVPHGHCFLWHPPLVWLHIISDALIALSYYSIPFTLLYFVNRRKDLPFDWIFMMFGAFIVLCGTTHVFEIWTLWYASYWTEGFVKVITAAVSIITAIVLVPLVPKALALPSPAQLEAANLALEKEIGDRKLAEENVRKLNQELEQRVKDRTQKLETANRQLQAEIAERTKAENKLRNYASRLEQSNQELQDFAYVASHDLQEPLRKIRTFGDRLQAKYAGLIGDKGQDYIERMQAAAARMQTLIEDLLTFSRVTTKAKPFVEIDLNEIVANVTSDLETMIEEVGGAVKIDHLPTIESDPLQIRQLFQNLISNGLKFHHRDRKPIVQITGSMIDNGTKCRLVVSDNGIGFNEKYLDRIFVVFQRLHGNSEYKGTGVGLAICRKIAERHGGSITATSTEGEGSDFIITLPVHHTHQDHSLQSHLLSSLDSQTGEFNNSYCQI